MRFWDFFQKNLSFSKEKVTHTEGIDINTQDCQTERFLNGLLIQVKQV